MNKTELIDAIAKAAGITKSKAKVALDTFTSNVIKTIVKGRTVTLIGFGSYSTGKRAARAGRNPRTGAKIKIPASKTVRFRAGKAFKDSVNKRTAAK